MADLPNRRGVHFDPTINLGHVASAAVFLVSTVAAWAAAGARASVVAAATSNLARGVAPILNSVKTVPLT